METETETKTKNRNGEGDGNGNGTERNGIDAIGSRTPKSYQLVLLCAREKAACSQTGATIRVKGERASF